MHRTTTPDRWTPGRLEGKPAPSSAAAIGHAKVIQQHAMDVRGQAMLLRNDPSVMSAVPAFTPGAYVSPVSFA